MMFGFSGMFGSWIPMLLWLVILIIVVYLVTCFLNRPTGKSQAAHSNAENILRERFARGEIDAETFLEMKKKSKEK